MSWTQLADGRPHRLKRGRHFEGDVRGLQLEATAVAQEQGRGVLALIDELGHHNHYLWVQFADQELIEGEVCRCGGASFSRSHERYATCDSCGATAVLKSAVGVNFTQPWRPGQRLSDYADVELIASDSDTDDSIERWYGRGVDPFGWDVLIEVDYVLKDGRRVPDELEAGEYVHRVRRWPIGFLTRAARLGVLDDWSAADDLIDALRHHLR
jgi:hypothetical protein